MPAPAAVHQFVSSFVPRDAVSMHALGVRGLLRDLGFDSEIFVKESRAEMVRESRFYRSFDPTGPAVLVYQAATGSAMADFLGARREPLVVNYHNLTPPQFFAAWEPHTAVELDVGRRQIADLAPRADLAVAVSAFNESDLHGLGYDPARTTVAPVLIDPATLHREVDPATRDRLEADGGDGPAILFVGRLAPNKAQHDLVKALAALVEVYGGSPRLRLVGAPSSPRYQRALRGLVAARGLEANVELAGSVTDAEAGAHYATADVFCCLSDHEGFCVPLLEAMHHGVPIVAYAAGAIPETLAGAGLLLPEKDPATVAAALHRVATDASLRERLVVAGRRRLQDFALDRARARFAEALRPVLEGVPV
ncbi:MAG: glycosyltransferase family 4 protein [Actinobacteria bacterium]|nr:glycosyltransferase family 4 protein [Actinomycetota bacterium]